MFVRQRINTFASVIPTILVPVILAQVALPCAIALFLFSLGNIQAVYSVLLGGLVCCLPNLLVAYGIFPLTGSSTPIRIARRFFMTEALKYALSILLMVLIFKEININPLAFFLTYLLSLNVFWMASWLPSKRAVS